MPFQQLSGQLNVAKTGQRSVMRVLGRIRVVAEQALLALSAQIAASSYVVTHRKPDQRYPFHGSRPADEPRNRSAGLPGPLDEGAEGLDYLRLRAPPQVVHHPPLDQR